MFYWRRKNISNRAHRVRDPGTNRRKLCPEQLEAQMISASSSSAGSDNDTGSLLDKVRGEEANSAETVHVGASSARHSPMHVKCSSMVDISACSNQNVYLRVLLIDALGGLDSMEIMKPAVWR